MKHSKQRVITFGFYMKCPSCHRQIPVSSTDTVAHLREVIRDLEALDDRDVGTELRYLRRRRKQSERKRR